MCDANINKLQQNKSMCDANIEKLKKSYESLKNSYNTKDENLNKCSNETNNTYIVFTFIIIFFLVIMIVMYTRPL